MPYHIVKTKSKTHPFQVVNVDSDNNEVINTSQLLKTKASAFKNIIANMDTIFNQSDEDCYVIVQDDTLKASIRYTLFDNGSKTKDQIVGYKKYIPGKNPKKK